MKEITALARGKRQNKRVNVFLDGKFSFSLKLDTAVQEGLKIGQQLSDDKLASLTKTDNFQRCLDAAMRYLNYRPRSEAELTTRLHQRSFPEEDINNVTRRLKELGLVDDIAFIRFWKDSRDSFSPRSQWLIKTELQRKGVNAEVIENVTADSNDYDSAYRAALSKAKHLASLDYQTFRHRLGDFLKRRGFSYEVIKETINRTWHEYQEESH